MNPQATTPIKSLLICATDRSGSTWLCDEIKRTGIAGNPDEYFSPVFKYSNDCFWPDDNPEELLIEAKRLGTTNNGIFSAKIMWWQFELFYSTMQKALNGLPTDQKKFFERFFPNPTFILLKRRNKVRQAISYERAQLTGKWLHRESWGKQHAGDKSLRARLRAIRDDASFDFPALLFRKNYFLQHEKSWEELFTVSNISFIEMVYEDLVQDLESHLSTIGTALNTTMTHADDNDDGRLVRQSGSKNAHWEKLYQKREAIFKTLPYPLSKLFLFLMRGEALLRKTPRIFISLLTALKRSLL